MMRKALVDSIIWRGIYFVTALLLNVCIARVYEANKSGWIYFISNNLSLVILVAGLSLDSSMTYFSASKQIAPGKLALFSLTWPFAVALIGIGCTVFLNWTGQITSDYSFLLVAGASFTFGISLTNFFTALFYAENNFVVPNVFLSSLNVAVIVLLPVFASGIGGLTKEHFLYFYFLQFILQGLGLAVLFLHLHAPTPSLTFLRKEEFKALLKFALIALSSNVAYYFLNRVDYFFVERWCSAKSFGNYVQVSKIGQLFLIIPSILASAIYPQVAKGNAGNVVKLILRLMCVFALIYIFIIIAAYFVSNAVFLWLFGLTFDEMFIPFIILLPGILFLSLHLIIAAYLGGRNKPHYNLISTGAGLVVVLAGDFFLIKEMGTAGAALVSTLGYTVAFIVSLILFVKETQTNWKEIASRDTFRLKTYTSLFATQPLNQ